MEIRLHVGLHIHLHSIYCQPSEKRYAIFWHVHVYFFIFGEQTHFLSISMQNCPYRKRGHGDTPTCRSTHSPPLYILPAKRKTLRFFWHVHVYFFIFGEQTNLLSISMQNCPYRKGGMETRLHVGLHIHPHSIYCQPSEKRYAFFGMFTSIFLFLVNKQIFCRF